AGDADGAGFQRLAKGIENRPLEFGKLVQEQHAKMGEADLARADTQPTADKCRHRCAMVRGPERPLTSNFATSELAGDRGDHRDLEGLAGLQWRQNPRQAGGEKRLSRS